VRGTAPAGNGTRATSAETATPTKRRWRRVAIAALLIAVMVSLCFAYVLDPAEPRRYTRKGEPSPIRPVPIAKTDFDRTPLRVSADIDLGPGVVGGLTANSKGVWLVIHDAGDRGLRDTARIVRVNAGGRLTKTSSIGGYLHEQLVSTRDSLWAVTDSADFAHAVLWHIDSTSGRVIAAVNVPSSSEVLAASPDSVWLGAPGLPGSRLIQLDRSTNRLTTLDLQTPGTAAAIEGALWGDADRGDTLERIDARTHALTKMKMPGAIRAIVAGDRALWVLGYDGSLLDVRANSLRVGRRSPATMNGESTESIVVAEGAVWLLIRGDGAVALRRIDPKTRDVRTADLTRFEPETHFFAVGYDSIWVVHEPPYGHARLRRLQPSS
jgi:hypothetical protein